MTPRTPIYTTRTRHSDAYYHSITNLLIQLLTANASDATIADQLNTEGLKTARGLAWTVGTVKTLLFSLRHAEDRRPHIYHAILRLAFNGVIKKSDTDVLFQNRRDYRGSGAMM